MLSLLGAALGFGTSVIPSIIQIFTQKQADSQELKMLEAKGKYAEQLSSLKLDELDAKAVSALTQHYRQCGMTIQIFYSLQLSAFGLDLDSSLN